MRALLLSLALILGVAGCGGEDRQPSSTTWRNVTIDLPDGWYLLEDEDTRLSIASHDLGAVDEDGTPILPDGDVVGMFFTYEPGAIPDDWRRWVQERDGVLESDESMVLGDDTPATRLIFTFVSNEVRTREMVVVIPSRQIVLLAQPVPAPGESDVTGVFMDHLDVFLEVLETARLGPPVLDE